MGFASSSSKFASACSSDSEDDSTSEGLQSKKPCLTHSCCFYLTINGRKIFHAWLQFDDENHQVAFCKMCRMAETQRQTSQGEVVMYGSQSHCRIGKRHPKDEGTCRQ